MDAEASHELKGKVYNYRLRTEESGLFGPHNVNHRNSTIKYTKLPSFDFDTRVSWPQNKNTLLLPRFRRVIDIKEPNIGSSRSLKVNTTPVSSSGIKNITRKIITITEADECDLPRKSTKRTSLSPRKLNRAIGAKIKEEKPICSNPSSGSYTSKYSKDVKSAKSNVDNRRNVSNVNNSKKRVPTVYIHKTTNTPNRREKEIKNMKTAETKSKINVKKKVFESNENGNGVYIVELQKIKESEANERAKTKKSSNCKGKLSFWDEIKRKNKPITVIHAPLEDLKNKHQNVISQYISGSKLNNLDDKEKKLKVITVDQDTETTSVESKAIGVDTLPKKMDQNTEVDLESSFKCKLGNYVDNTLDILDIPNVTLTKDQNLKEEVLTLCSKSLPNLQTHTFKITSPKCETCSPDSKSSKCSSFIIGRATLTYTTRQKINFHVVNNNSNESTPSLSPSPLAYPLNVISIYKKKIKTTKFSSDSSTTSNENTLNHITKNQFGEIPTIHDYSQNKLIKPSDIIGAVKFNCLLVQDDYLCEEFQRELNFIDSFFESLQYLENCSLTDKYFSTGKCENWLPNIELDEFDEHRSLVSKFANEVGIEENETMVSKSLSMLNSLIRHEQRRARNLLLVLKMREEAMKDFTKSHILWLENKKKQYNTDMSALKKKQRAALLKLQFECGEMQKMRKALLTLTEKRKAALMKTKRNIELKLKNSVDVEKMLIGKRNLKKISPDRNTAPLKCFDLSSSSCEEKSTKTSNNVNMLVTEVATNDQSVQTGDSILEIISTDLIKDTTAENCVIVDGAYLNILFHNLSLPKIFSGGKQYEVNEDALKNIVNTANIKQHSSNRFNDIDQFDDQAQSTEHECSNSPSTAHSLVEELNQIYEDFIQEEKPQEVSKNIDYRSPIVYEIKDQMMQVEENFVTKYDQKVSNVIENTYTENEFSSQSKDTCIDSQCHNLNGNELFDINIENGPLPVPVGAPSTDNAPPLSTIVTATHSFNTANSVVDNESEPSVSSAILFSSPVHSEAEELRRQQLAIEREIKALEQQQNQLLVMREIPDKPPPPYKPPIEACVVTKPPKKFIADEIAQEKLLSHIVEPESVSVDRTDPFEVFLIDCSDEITQKQKAELSDEPWQACNLLPQKTDLGPQDLAKKISQEITDILSGVPSIVVSGVSTRRSDHIDDILFTEWRRCEPEWTSLHIEEVAVKNQVFESIFQKILTETIDNYKRYVVGQCSQDEELESSHQVNA